MDLRKICRICGNEASGFNYQVLTCQSCKVFFYRNAHQKEKLFCLKEGNCSMLNRTKRLCSKCRMEKCIQIGMAKEFKTTQKICSYNSNAQVQEVNNNEILFGIGPILDVNIVQNFNKLNNNQIETVESFTSIQNSICRLNLKQYELAQISYALHELRSIFYEEGAIKNIKRQQMVKASSLSEVSNSYQLYMEKIAQFCPKIEAYNQLNSGDRHQTFKTFCFSFLTIRGAFTYDKKNDGHIIVENESATSCCFLKYDYEQREKMQHLFEFNRNCLISLHDEMENDATIRDLLSLQLLFKPFNTVSCAEFMRYQQMFYSKLLHRYLAHKYRNSGKASRKYMLLSRLTNNLAIVRENEAKLLRSTADKLPHVFKEIFDLV